MSYLDFIDPGNAGGSVKIPELPAFQLSPIIYQCTICPKNFKTRDELFQHRFENHPFLKPALFLRGVESTTPRIIISRLLMPLEITVANTDRFKINGKFFDEASFVDELTSKKRGIVELALLNQGVETVYELEFDIVSISDLNEVDRLFFALLGSSVLDISLIDNFIDATEHFKTAGRYVDGLSNYLYGLLAKDQRGGTHLEQYEYKQRFNVALDILKLFETPLAVIVTAIINFNQNIFKHSDLSDLSPKFNLVMAKFFCVVNNQTLELSSMPVGKNYARVPLDRHTDQLIEWATLNWNDLSGKRKELEKVINSVDWVPDDRFKARILFAEMCVAVGDFSHAKIQVRSIVNDSIFGAWAQNIMDRSN